MARAARDPSGMTTWPSAAPPCPVIDFGGAEFAPGRPRECRRLGSSEVAQCDQEPQARGGQLFLVPAHRVQLEPRADTEAPGSAERPFVAEVSLKPDAVQRVIFRAEVFERSVRKAENAGEVEVR